MTPDDPTRPAHRRSAFRLLTAIWLAAACLFAGAGRDTPSGPAWGGTVTAAAFDESHPSLQADSTVARFDSRRLAAGRSPVRRVRRSVARLGDLIRRAVNRWHRPPVAWCGPPILRT